MYSDALAQGVSGKITDFSNSWSLPTPHPRRAAGTSRTAGRRGSYEALSSGPRIVRGPIRWAMQSLPSLQSFEDEVSVGADCLVVFVNSQFRSVSCLHPTPPLKDTDLA